MFIGYGIVATVFLLIGFWIGIKSQKEKKINPCLTCQWLARYHTGKKYYRYICDRLPSPLDRFDKAPEYCRYYEKKENIE